MSHYADLLVRHLDLLALDVLEASGVKRRFALERLHGVAIRGAPAEEQWVVAEAGPFEIVPERVAAWERGWRPAKPLPPSFTIAVTLLEAVARNKGDGCEYADEVRGALLTAFVIDPTGRYEVR